MCVYLLAFFFLFDSFLFLLPFLHFKELSFDFFFFSRKTTAIRSMNAIIEINRNIPQNISSFKEPKIVCPIFEGKCQVYSVKEKQGTGLVVERRNTLQD